MIIKKLTIIFALLPVYIFGGDICDSIFPVGWYMDNNIEHFNTAVGVDNHYKYTDPFSKYYNTFAVYNVNKLFFTGSPESIAASNIGTKTVFENKYIIYDLPRYSSIFRVLYYPDAYSDKVSIDDKIFKCMIIDTTFSIIKKSSDVKAFKKAYFQSLVNIDFPKSKYPFFYSLFLKSDSMFSDKETEVYRYGDIFSFSYMFRDSSSFLIVKLEVSTPNGYKTILICPELKLHKDTPVIRNLEKLDYSLIVTDSLIFAGGNTIQFPKLISFDASGKAISSWKYFSFNIDTILYYGIGETRLKTVNISYFADNVTMGQTLFSFNNKFAEEKVKKIVESISKQTKNKIFGFYLSDEFERKEVLSLSRWADGQKISSDNYLESYITNMYSYIDSLEYLPLVLSTTQTKLNKEAYPILFEKRMDKFRNPIFMFDDYTDGNAYIDYFYKIRSRADSMGSSVLFVSDAYRLTDSFTGDFENIRFKLLSSIILGADGIMFYSYYSNFPKNFSAFLKDPNKIGVGLTSQYLHDYFIQNRSIFNRKFFKNDKSRYSMITADSAIYWGILTKKASSGKAENVYIGKKDIDYKYLSSLVDKTHGYAVFEISPYLQSQKLADSLSLPTYIYPSGSYIVKKSSSDKILSSVNKLLQNKRFTENSIRFFCIVESGIYEAPTFSFNENGGEMSFNCFMKYPQLLKNNNMEIFIFKSKIVDKKLLSFKVTQKFSGKAFYMLNNSINYSFEAENLDSVVIKYTDVFGKRFTKKIR